MGIDFKLGRCINNGRCGLADRGKAIAIDPNGKFICPECRRDLIPADPKPRRTEGGAKLKRPPRLLILSAITITVMVAIGLYFDLFRGFDLEDTPAVQTQSDTSLVVPAGFVRIGTSTATFDNLAPLLARGFLTHAGCLDQTDNRSDSRILLACGTEDHRELKISVTAPGAIVNQIGKETKFFDVLITTDPVPALPQARVRTADAPVHARAIAVDALAVIVHPKNPLNRLSQAELAAIFQGRTRDFGAVGGPAGTIEVIVPTGSAVADERLAAIVPRWLPLSPQAKRLATSDAIYDAVMADPRAIGLVDAKTVRRAKALRIGPANGIATPVSPLALISGDYPLARGVTAVRFNTPASAIEMAVLDFAASPAGRDAIRLAGFEPVRHQRFLISAPAIAPSTYKSLVKGADRLAAHLRFLPDRLDFDPRSEADLDAIATELGIANIAADRIIVIGLTDPGLSTSGDAGNLARRVATALAERRLPVGTTTDFGGALPVSASNTVEERNHNRRVEIWIRRK